MVNVRYVTQVIPQIPPHKAGGGSTDTSQGQNQAGSASQKNEIWKDSGKDDQTTSLENTGNEKMPSNLNSLGTWGQGTTLDDAEWHADQFGEVNDQSSGDWGSAYVRGSSDVLKVEGRVYGDTSYGDGTVKASGGVQGRVE